MREVRKKLPLRDGWRWLTGGGREKREYEKTVGFFQLWRYASYSEVLAAWLACALGCVCACALLFAIVIYGELTALFVARHNAADTPPAPVLSLFGGGRHLQSGDRPVHMEELVADSVAFAWASLVAIVAQIGCAAAAVAVANYGADSHMLRVRRSLLTALLAQELAWFDTEKTTDIASTLTEQTERVRAGVGEQIAMFSYLAGSAVAGSLLALVHGWQLTLAGLAVVPLSVLSSALISLYQARFSARESTALGVASRSAEEALAAVRTVAAFGGEKVEVKRYEGLLRSADVWGKKRVIATAAGAGMGWLLTYSLNAVVLWYGSALVARDLPLPPQEREYHPGVVVTILFTTFAAAQNIALCQPHLETFAGARGAAAAIYKLLERKPQLKNEGKIKPQTWRGEVKFEDVRFNYPARPDVKVLQGFSLTASPGQTVALVGTSGCGKSTALQLLQRLYEPHSGRIYVDGHLLQDLDLQHYRMNIGVVGQEPVLFSGTIRENIVLGLPEATQQQIETAARTAHAHEFIMKLPQGYDTPVGDRGAQLSGGQKQRIAIARALIRNPRLLLLDEPTSALDSASERMVQAALDAAAAGRTTLVVSHRLSTITGADRIVVVDAGSVVESGTHDKLLASHGRYWELLQADASRNEPITPNAPLTPQTEPGSPIGDYPSGVSIVRSRASVRGSKRGFTLSHSSSTAGVLKEADAEEEMELTQTSEDYDEEYQKVKSLGWWKVINLHAAEWPQLVAGAGASLLVGATMPAFAVLFSAMFAAFSDDESGDGPSTVAEQGRFYAILFLCVAAACGVVCFLQSALLALAGAKLTNRLRKLVFQAMLQQEAAWFDSPTNSPGALSGRLAAECGAVKGAGGARLGALLQGASTMLIGVALSAAYSWKMTLVSLVSVPFVMGGIYLEGWASRRSASRAGKELETAAKVAAEAVINIRTVQSLGVEEAMLSRYWRALAAGNAAGRAAGRLRGPVYGACLAAPTLGYAVSMSYGGYLIAREDLPYQNALLVSEALIYGAWMLGISLSLAPSFTAAHRAAARLLSLLQRQPAIVDVPDDGAPWTVAGDVAFDKVEFTYGRRPAVLRGLSLEAAHGRRVALVGPSGSGKSTLIQLLLRFYDPTKGDVLLDGKSIRSVPLRKLRAQFGLVGQQPVLFDRSVYENIAYGDNARDGAVPLAEVQRAARMANVDSFIAALPQGYETRLGSGGAQLSGGQKQRIAIARALLRDPRVLLLDEATSALDSASEQAVQATLEEVSAGRTTVTVAHRLPTIKNADVIYVIDKGIVAESGNHEELMRKKGIYNALWKQQQHNS